MEGMQAGILGDGGVQAIVGEAEVQATVVGGGEMQPPDKVYHTMIFSCGIQLVDWFTIWYTLTL
jgi:hypothetical protein